ncbi:uncharacterized protein EI90DRAFT_3126598 [Cantharellus anzutake]|uniref:uncharacterized protein n=1 Tax=Cantharellus anzutake TaxID=1750568 RepID=UPI0019063E0C|nr:uncharacterized protein EI90DRAFT_3126598 [Cantharellus anzutake]KAF8327950.1 hypothetical protein EI90DRAFT_3126598 [Cantharellus anzutake]
MSQTEEHHLLRQCPATCEGTSVSQQEVSHRSLGFAVSLIARCYRLTTEKEALLVVPGSMIENAAWENNHTVYANQTINSLNNHNVSVAGNLGRDSSRLYISILRIDAIPHAAPGPNSVFLPYPVDQITLGGTAGRGANMLQDGPFSAHPVDQI